MQHLERLWEERNRAAVLAVSGAITLIIALVDWWTKPYVSLGFLYLFPIMLAAGFIPRWLIALLGFACAELAEVFSSLEPSFVRLSFETLALAGCGLFVGELVRNRRLSVEAQARLKVLVETSPAAIVTVDERGFIELANRAATELMTPRGGLLIGSPVAAFLPELHHALRWEEAPQFRASMQCRGHRDDGEWFTADVWFSTYTEGRRPKVAAIIADVTEEAAVSNSNSSPHTPDHLGPAVLNKRGDRGLAPTRAGTGEQRNRSQDGDLGKCREEHDSATVREDWRAHSRTTSAGRAGAVPQYFMTQIARPIERLAVRQGGFVKTQRRGRLWAVCFLDAFRAGQGAFQRDAHQLTPGAHARLVK